MNLFDGSFKKVHTVLYNSQVLTGWEYPGKFSIAEWQQKCTQYNHRKAFVALDDSGIRQCQQKSFLSELSIKPFPVYSLVKMD